MSDKLHGRHGEPWEVGKDGGTIVSQDPVLRAAMLASPLSDYGGAPIAESMDRPNRDRAMACVNALAGLNPEAARELLEAAMGLHAYSMDSTDVVNRNVRRFNTALAALEKPMTETHKPELDQGGETSIDQHDAAQEPERIVCSCGCGADAQKLGTLLEIGHLVEKLDAARAELHDEKADLEIAERERKEAKASYDSLLAMTQTTASQLQDEIDRVRS